jgi:hypothetical protein
VTFPTTDAASPKEAVSVADLKPIEWDVMIDVT